MVIASDDGVYGRAAPASAVMVRKYAFAHVVGVLLCCWNQATVSALRMLREAYIGWMA